MPSERTFKAPVAEYNNRIVFSRFKYAEEAAHKLENDGHVWVMFRDHDRIDIEDDDVYTVEQYVVLWNE